MRKTWIVAVATLVSALSGGGCTGSSNSSVKTTTPAPTANVPAASTPMSAPVSVPAKPASFSDYAPVIATYLTANPSAAGGNCLAELIAAWKMPLITMANGCIAANTDGDPQKEVVAVITTKLTTPTASTDTQFDVVVFHAAGGAYHVAYESGPSDVVPPGSTIPISPVLYAGDLIDDGGGELAYVTTTCGASTCSQTVHILKGTAGGYVSLAPADGISMASAEARFVDVDGDSAKELLLTGGAIGSVGAGPQRARTETWAWNGATYALRSTELDKPAYLYHAVKDADALFAASKYADAVAAYAAVVGDASLLVWSEQKNERNELESYSLFRAGLAVAEAGGDTAKANGYLDRARGYQPQTLHGQLAGSFKAGLNAKGSVAVGCSAVRDDIAANLAEYQAFWDFGYGNPPFAADSFCPF
jgi:hypothetical protein